jgi:hypothetical protein
MTNNLKRFALVAVIGFVSQGLGTAQPPDSRMTKVTIDAPVRLPAVTLQPGTYVVKLLNDDANRHIVQFFDKDARHVITTTIAIPNQRLKPTGKSVFTFWEVPAGQPKALRAWFYPGDDFGQEFAYPKEQAAQISASNNGANVPVNEDKTADVATTSSAAAAEPPPAVADAQPAADSAPAPAPVELAAAAPEASAPPAALPATIDQPASSATTSVDTSDAQQVSQATPETLPKTASNLPLYALVGVLLIVGALALNFAYNRA